MYIIDPDGIDYLLSHMQNTSFQIIYIIADEEKKQEMALSRAPDERKDKELETYKARCAAEDKQFSDFERKIALKHAPKQEPSSENERRKQNNVNREKLISRTNVFVNVYDKNASKRYADKLTNDLRSWNKIYDKLQEEVKSGNIMIRTGYLEQLTDCLYQGM